MRVLAAALSVSALVLSCGAQPQAPSVYLHFNGVDQYVEVPSAPELSPTDNGFTVSAWMMPDTLTFPNPEGSGYVHWMGKDARGQQEWLFRMYNQTNTEKPPRPNRISFYVFNPDGGLGVGSYFQDSVQPNTWIQVTGIADGQRTYMYKDGVMRRCDQYQGPLTAGCTGHPEVIHPQAGGAPLRIGSRDLRSYFQGGIAGIRVWNRALSASEVQALHDNGEVARSGLVAEYLLNEGTGSVAHDTAGHHDGRIVGATWATR